MNAFYKILPAVALLLLGGCASLDHSAETAVEQTSHDNSSDTTPVDDGNTVPASEPIIDTTVVIAEPVPEPPPFWDQVRDGFRLPGAEQPGVKKRAAEYGKHPKQVERIFKRGSPYLAYILSEVQKRDFPTELVLLPFVESGYDPFAFSYGRAAGMWQFIPATGKLYGLDQDWWYDGRRDVVESTQAALNYLDYLQEKFDGDWLLAIAAYNSGSGAVSKAIKKNRAAGKPTDFWHLKLPKETSAYVPKLLAVKHLVEEPGRYDISLMPVDIEPAFTTVEIPGQMDISVAAELAGIDTKTLYLLNPGYNRWTTHPEGPHKILIPVANQEAFVTNLASLPEEQRIRLYRHKIKSGETLSKIALDYDTSTAALMNSNQLDSTMIRSGQYLLVPTGSRDTVRYANLNKRIQAANESSQKQTYRVRQGDNLWNIARKHNVTVKQVSNWNKLNVNRPIRPGQKLVIYKRGRNAGPSGNIRTVVYTVRNGDSLYRISKKFRVSIKDLIRWNNLNKDKHLQPGQNLKLYVDITRQYGQGRG